MWLDTPKNYQISYIVPEAHAFYFYILWTGFIESEKP